MVGRRVGSAEIVTRAGGMGRQVAVGFGGKRKKQTGVSVGRQECRQVGDSRHPTGQPTQLPQHYTLVPMHCTCLPASAPAPTNPPSIQPAKPSYPDTNPPKPTKPKSFPIHLPPQPPEVRRRVQPICDLRGWWVGVKVGGEPAHPPAFPPARLPTSLPTNLTSLPHCSPTLSSTYLPAYIPTDIPTLPTNLPTCVPTCVPTYLTTHPPCQPTYLPTYLPTNQIPRVVGGCGRVGWAV